MSLESKLVDSRNFLCLRKLLVKCVGAQVLKIDLWVELLLGIKLNVTSVIVFISKTAPVVKESALG